MSKEREDIPNYIRWGALLYNREFEAIPKIVKNIMTDKERERIMDKIDKLTRDDLFMSELEAREWAEWEEKSKMTYARNTGLSKGKEEATKEMILSMIDNNLSMEMISKITNKTIEEIEEIIKDN